MLTYVVTLADHCRQAESFLHNLLPGASRGYRQQLFKGGHLQVNGAVVPPDRLLLLGDSVSLKESGRINSLLAPARPAMDLLFEDDCLAVVNKEPGRPVHATAEDSGSDLVAFCQHYLERRGTPCKLRPVNRLDRGTSGIVILAKSPTVAGIMGRFIHDTGLAKTYLAVVGGTLPPDGEIDLPLEGKESLTRFRRLHQGERAAIAAVWPVSGRMHQIRKHFSLSGRPILGDRRYGGETVPGLGGQALHAFAVAFPHPLSAEPLTLYAPLPPGMALLLERTAGAVWPRLLAELATLAPAPAAAETLGES